MIRNSIADARWVNTVFFFDLTTIQKIKEFNVLTGLLQVHFLCSSFYNEPGSSSHLSFLQMELLLKQFHHLVGM